MIKINIPKPSVIKKSVNHGGRSTNEIKHIMITNCCFILKRDAFQPKQCFLESAGVKSIIPHVLYPEAMFLKQRRKTKWNGNVEILRNEMTLPLCCLVLSRTIVLSRFKFRRVPRPPGRIYWTPAVSCTDWPLQQLPRFVHFPLILSFFLSYSTVIYLPNVETNLKPNGTYILLVFCL